MSQSRSKKCGSPARRLAAQARFCFRRRATSAIPRILSGATALAGEGFEKEVARLSVWPRRRSEDSKWRRGVLRQLLLVVAPPNMEPQLSPRLSRSLLPTFHREGELGEVLGE